MNMTLVLNFSVLENRETFRQAINRIWNMHGSIFFTLEKSIQCRLRNNYICIK